MAIVGGGPAGLACAIKVMQLLEDEPELTEKPRRGAGGRDREGQGRGRAPALRGEHAPLRDAGAVPRPRPLRLAGLRGGDQGRRLPADLEARAAAEAAAAELPKPRQLRDLDREAGRGSSARRPRRRASTCSPRPPPTSCWSPTGSSAGSARATRDATATAGELANFEPGSDVVAKATVLAEGTQGHLTGAAIDYFELAGPSAAALGARGQGGLDRFRSRSTG